jgi:hypothetical protein
MTSYHLQGRSRPKTSPDQPPTRHGTGKTQTKPLIQPGANRHIIHQQLQKGFKLGSVSPFRETGGSLGMTIK